MFGQKNNFNKFLIYNNKENIMKKFVIDILSLDNQKYHAIRLKINKNFEYIKTSHISLVNDAWEQGYEIFIFNGTQEINIRDCTVKELRPIHNIQRLFFHLGFPPFLFGWRTGDDYDDLAFGLVVLVPG